MKRVHLQRLMLEELGGVGLLQDFAFGLYQYMARARFFQQITNYQQLDELIAFLQEMKDLTGGLLPFKSKSFNYLSDEHRIARLTHEITSNAEYMISLLGMDLFAASEDNPRHRKRFYRAGILDSEFAMTCCGGQGGGTFSLEIMIEEGLARPLKGLIWYIGIDLPIIEGERRLRIISSSSGIKPGINYEERIKTLRRFEGHYGMRIESALVILCLYIAYDLGIDTVSGLTSEGVKVLSKRKARQRSFSYDRLLAETGFTESNSPHWGEIRGLQERFHSLVGAVLLSSARRAQSIVSPTQGLKALLCAFQDLVAHDDGSAIPLTVCGSHQREGIETALDLIHLRTGLASVRPEKRGPTPPRQLDTRGLAELSKDAIELIETSQRHFEQSSSAIHHSINRSIQAIRRRLKALGEISSRTTTQEALRLIVTDEVAEAYRRYLINRRTVFKVDHAAKSNSALSDRRREQGESERG